MPTPTMVGIGRSCRNEDRGEIVQILFNGLCNGALIALLAMAFVVVYLPTKVFYIALAGIYDGLEAKDISVRACSHKRKENA